MGTLRAHGNRNDRSAALSFLALALLSCAHRQEPALPESGENASIRYRDFNQEARALLVHFERRFGQELRSTSELATISGQEALALLDQRKPGWTLGDEFDGYIRELLGNSNSKAVLFSFPDSPGLPTGAVFIPWPAAGSFRPPPDDDPDSPGAILALGLDEAAIKTLARSFPKLELRPSWPVLSSSMFQSLEASGDPFVVIIHASGCRGSDGIYATLANVIASLPRAPDVFLDVEGEVTGHLSRRQIGTVFFPTLEFFRGGELVDLQVGSNVQDPSAGVRHFLGRNGVEVGSIQLASDFRSADESEWRARIRTLSIIHHLPVANFDGSDLSGLELRRGSLSGASLRNANLARADLRDSILAHADLTGANLDGALLEGVFWKSTICPDGTNSDTHGGVCDESTFVGPGRGASGGR